MIEPVCAAVLVLLSLCASPSQPDPSRASAREQILGVSPSTDLLGRQVVVAPAAANGSPWGDPSRLAYCSPDGIQRTLDGGQTWSPVPTDGVAALAATTDMPLAPRLGAAPACQSVVLDPRQPDTFYAVFQAVKLPQDAPPPWFAAGYLTRDAGQTWEPIPAPQDAEGIRFGGFAADQDGVQALFGREPAPLTGRSPADADTDSEVAPPVVLATTDAGRTWKPTPFGCPADGPCIRWGAPPTGIGSCNMHAYPQPLLRSDDDGHTWNTPNGAHAVNGCQPNELVMVSAQDVLLLAPGGDELDAEGAPVRVSHDGGRTFTAVTLPEGPAAADLFELYLLPDARLLARVSGSMPGPGWSWQILARSSDPAGSNGAGSSGWCNASAGPLPTTGGPLQVAGDRLWWLASPDQPASLALADLRCDAPNDGTPPREGETGSGPDFCTVRGLQSTALQTDRAQGRIAVLGADAVPWTLRRGDERLRQWLGQ